MKFIGRAIDIESGRMSFDSGRSGPVPLMSRPINGGIDESGATKRIKALCEDGRSFTVLLVDPLGWAVRPSFFRNGSDKMEAERY